MDNQDPAPDKPKKQPDVIDPEQLLMEYLDLTLHDEDITPEQRRQIVREAIESDATERSQAGPMEEADASKKWQDRDDRPEVFMGPSADREWWKAWDRLQEPERGEEEEWLWGR